MKKIYKKFNSLDFGGKATIVVAIFVIMISAMIGITQILISLNEKPKIIIKDVENLQDRIKAIKEKKKIEQEIKNKTVQEKIEMADRLWGGAK